MKRRTFLQSIGALGLSPMVPAPFLNAAPAAAATVAKDTYQWAEMIVRAHNKCNLGMLQRLLQIDNTTASALKSELLKNGVISAQANAYGMHTAVKPLYEGAFVRPSSEIGKLKTNLKASSENTETSGNNNRALEDKTESLSKPLESHSEAVESMSEEENTPLVDDENPDTLIEEETINEQETHERTSG